MMKNSCSLSPCSLESQKCELYSHPTRWTLLGRVYEDGSFSVHRCRVSEQVYWRNASVFSPVSITVLLLTVVFLALYDVCDHFDEIVSLLWCVPCRLVGLIKDYCGSVCEKTVRMNFALIYELLDEMVVSHTHAFIIFFYLL